MIICPNCNHENPDEAAQCELCYSPLPATSSCPECGSSVQADATFCGQCGHNLKANSTPDAIPPTIVSAEALEAPSPEVSAAIPPTVQSFTGGIEAPTPTAQPNSIPETEFTERSAPAPLPTDLEVASESQAELHSEPTGERVPLGSDSRSQPKPRKEQVFTAPEPAFNEIDEFDQIKSPVESNRVEPSSEVAAHTSPTPDSIEPEPKLNQFTPNPIASSPPSSSSTQLQSVKASLLQVQTDTKIEIPQHLAVVHIGKPNNQIPPDVDVSGYPNSEIVSRVHADIRIEGDAFFIEDMGSSNGTYVNHTPLLTGDRHRLRSGDRISLGKGDKVTFIFQFLPY